MTRAPALVLALAFFAPTTVHAQSVLPDDYEEPARDDPRDAEDADDEAQPEEAQPDDEADEADEPEARRPAPRRTREKEERPDTQVRKKSPRAKKRFDPPNRHLSSGLGFELELGGLAAIRRMNFTGTEREITHRPGVYLGGALRANQHLLTLDATNSHLFAEAEGGFGSAKNADIEPALGRPLVTEHAYLMVLGVFERPVQPSWDVRLGLGAIATSFTVEPNPDYTGHRYLALAAKFGAAHWLSEAARVGANVIFFPGVATNQSAGGYGGGHSFGGRGEAHFSWRFYQPERDDAFGSAELGARYSFTRFQTTLPESQHLGDLARTSDVQHALVLTVSYHL